MELSELSLLPSLSVFCLLRGPYGTGAGYVRHCVPGRDRFPHAPESGCPVALRCHESFLVFLLCFVCARAKIKSKVVSDCYLWALPSVGIRPLKNDKMIDSPSDL